MWQKIVSHAIIGVEAFVSDTLGDLQDLRATSSPCHVLLPQRSFFRSGYTAIRGPEQRARPAQSVPPIKAWRRLFFIHLSGSSGHFPRRCPDLELKGRRRDHRWGRIIFELCCVHFAGTAHELPAGPRSPNQRAGHRLLEDGPRLPQLRIASGIQYQKRTKRPARWIPTPEVSNYVTLSIVHYLVHAQGTYIFVAGYMPQGSLSRALYHWLQSKQVCPWTPNAGSKTHTHGPGFF